MKHYRSSIPTEARERVVATFLKSPRKYKVECVLNGTVVGIRYFYETGELAYECPLKNGVIHGIQYRSDVPGTLVSAEPYSDGLPHGTAKQWSANGELVGTYRMKRGTGIDLWWCARTDDGSPYVSEVRYVKDGKWDGYEWWLNEDQKSVWQERHFLENQLHGIERVWNAKGRLRRGYPRYWVNGARVVKREYLRACTEDATLPPFHETDNLPGRTLSIIPGDPRGN